jgi:3-methyladenine DNA glycosylase AlkC
MNTPAPRGARRMADIPSERLALLNTGEAEAANLMECLAVDFAAVMGAVAPEVGGAAITAMARAAGLGVSRRMALAASLLLDGAGDGATARLQAHGSDTVRGWACFMIAAGPAETLRDRLMAMRPLADDPHFGVREWAWLALRPHVAASPGEAIDLLAPWTGESSERLRRFASEATRPRGVWSVHIATLKQRPEQGLRILDPLRADPARYVQDSVGNWLNDAAKSQPAWVRTLCARWRKESDCAATRRICSRALRSLD